MSILITGLEMPKDGCHHMICVYADGMVSTGGRVYTAAPVSPHGGLKVVKTLTQNVLDEIRAEVEQLPITDIAVRLVIEVIDKHKEEIVKGW